ncbi:hypothetical protein [Lactococcus kimchii]|nr:hypothetical protein [Lactococcus sp. S-13]
MELLKNASEAIAVGENKEVVRLCQKQLKATDDELAKFLAQF